MATGFKFLPQVEAKYPGNADLSNALLRFGQGLGEGITAYRQSTKNRLLADAYREGGLPAAEQVAAENGYLDNALKYGAENRQRGIQDEQRALQAEERQRSRSLASDLAGLLPETIRPAAAKMTADELLKLYGQQSQQQYQNRSLDIQDRYRTDQIELGRENLAAGQAQQRDKLAVRMYQMLGDNPTQQQWEEANQPGGIINAAFGAPVPFNQRSVVLAQAKQKALTVDAGELEGLGFSPDVAQRLRRDQALRKILRQPKSGYRWEIKDGAPVEVPTGAEGGKQIDPTTVTTVARSLKTLENVHKVLVNDLNSFQIALGGNTNGWLGGKAATALNQAEASAMNLSYALSGKTITNAEQKRFAQLYMPRSYDPQHMRKAKLNELSAFYLELHDTLNKNKWTKAATDAAAERIRDRLAARVPVFEFVNPDTGDKLKADNGSLLERQRQQGSGPVRPSGADDPLGIR